MTTKTDVVLILVFVTLTLVGFNNGHAGCKFVIPENNSDRKEDTTVRFGMPDSYLTSRTDCSRNWLRHGWDADILYTLALRTNNMDGCVNVGRGEAFPNCTFKGGMLDLYDGKVDIYGKARTQEVSLRNVVEYLYPHKQENVCMMVKRRALDREIALPTFSSAIWIATAVSLLVVTIVFRWVYGLSIERTLVEIWRTFVTGEFENRQRRIMISLSFFSFVLMNFFSGCFVGSLVAPDEADEIDTLKEVNEIYDLIYTTSAAAEAILKINEEDDSTLFSLVQKVRTVRKRNEQRDAVEKAAVSSKSAIVSTESILESFKRYPEATENGYTKFHRVKECVLVPAYDSFVVRKGWPLKDRFSAMLQHMVEGGIVSKVFVDNLEKERKEKNGIILNEGSPPVTYSPFSLLLLAPLFVLWIAGVSVATLTFRVEMHWMRWRKCRRSKKKKTIVTEMFHIKMQKSQPWKQHMFRNIPKAMDGFRNHK